MKSFLFALLLGLSVFSAGAVEKKRHLLIFVGEENLNRVQPELSVIRVIQADKRFKKDEVKSVKYISNKLPIASLDEAWEKKDKKTKKPNGIGKKYKNLLSTIKNSIHRKKYDNVVLFWYQGESDAKNGWGAEYGESVARVTKKLEEDLGLGKIDVAITRLNDAKMLTKRNPDWATVRNAQNLLTQQNKKWILVSTDKYNGPGNLAKLNSKGYRSLAADYAKVALHFLAKPAVPKPVTP